MDKMTVILLGLSLCWSCGAQAEYSVSPPEFTLTQDARIVIIRSPDNVEIDLGKYTVCVKKIYGRWYVTEYSYTVDKWFYRYVFDWDEDRYNLVNVMRMTIDIRGGSNG